MQAVANFREQARHAALQDRRLPRCMRLIKAYSDINWVQLLARFKVLILDMQMLWRNNGVLCEDTEIENPLLPPSFQAACDILGAGRETLVQLWDTEANTLCFSTYERLQFLEDNLSYLFNADVTLAPCIIYLEPTDLPLFFIGKEKRQSFLNGRYFLLQHIPSFKGFCRDIVRTTHEDEPDWLICFGHTAALCIVHLAQQPAQKPKPVQQLPPGSEMHLVD